MFIIIKVICKALTSHLWSLLPLLLTYRIIDNLYNIQWYPHQPPIFLRIIIPPSSLFPQFWLQSLLPPYLGSHTHTSLCGSFSGIIVGSLGSNYSPIIIGVVPLLPPIKSLFMVYGYAHKPPIILRIAITSYSLFPLSEFVIFPHHLWGHIHAPYSVVTFLVSSLGIWVKTTPPHHHVGSPHIIHN